MLYTIWINEWFFDMYTNFAQSLILNMILYFTLERLLYYTHKQTSGNMVDPDMSRASLVLKIVTKHKHIANLQILLKAFNDIVDFRLKLNEITYQSSQVENSLEINNIIDRIASQKVLLASFESELQIIDNRVV